VTSVAGASQSFTGETSVTVTHNFNSLRQVVACYDGSAQEIKPHTVTTGLASTVIVFTGAQTGSCTVLGGTGLYSQAFTTQTSVSLTHALDTQAVIVACYDDSNILVEPSTLTATSTSAATVTFETAQTGSCVVAASLALGGGGGGSGTVTSVAITAPVEVTVSGSPITGAGTLALSWTSQSAGMVLASPPGTTGIPAARQLETPHLAATAKTGSGTRLATAASVPVNGCATWTDGNIASTAVACGTGGGSSYTAGTGISIVGSEISVDAATVPTFLTGSAALSDWNSGADNVPAQSCQEKSFTLAGAATGESVAPGWPAALPAGISPSMYVGGASSIVARLCNVTTGAVAVADGLAYRATILKTF
jgi:hypothetical protein